ncbi:hypothetical protein [Microvirga rosea]|uniref:hypothetical protein n=1 Tax=Microvirga rosea TaxID=2715425 RepID=UPI001D0AF678|nr:hypothetical protein [Microvirga rosea]MCB8821564.1 hypothetical protein [Microvirga rosea]
MDIAVKRELVAGRPTMAVYCDGRCVETGLSEERAMALMASLLNDQFMQAHSV